MTDDENWREAWRGEASGKAYGDLFFKRATGALPEMESSKAAAKRLADMLRPGDRILDAGPKHLTVYLFEADKTGTSACAGGCASVWPPVTGTASVAGTAISADLGTIKRPGGATVETT